MKSLLDGRLADGSGKVSSHKQAESWNFLTFSGFGFTALIMLFYFSLLVGCMHLLPFVLFCFHNAVLVEPHESLSLSCEPWQNHTYYKWIYVMN